MDCIYNHWLLKVLYNIAFILQHREMGGAALGTPGGAPGEPGRDQRRHRPQYEDLEDCGPIGTGRRVPAG